MKRPILFSAILPSALGVPRIASAAAPVIEVYKSAPQLTSDTTATKRKEATMNSLSKLALAAAITLSSASVAFAQNADHGTNHAPSMSIAQNSAASNSASGEASAMSEGEIKKVDKETGKVTIKHSALKNIDMPAMTMVFRAKDASMLDQVKAGDKVSFVAEKVGGQFTVTQIEVKK
jgi:Cu(I)/Ag(I) efflux system protein CusF